MDKQELKQEIEKKKAELESFELDPDDYEEQYRELLRDMTGDVVVCGLTFDAARIVEELDPTAFRCGLLDYMDGEDVTQDKNYQRIEEEIEELENELADLEESEENSND